MSNRTTGTLFWLPVIIDNEDLDAVDKMLLVTLVDHVDADDQAWPGVDRLAAGASVSYATAKRRLTALTERGYLTRERRRSEGKLRGYTYTLVREAFGLGLIPHPSEPASRAHPEQVLGLIEDVSRAHNYEPAEVPSIEPPKELTTANDAVRRTANRVVTEWWERRKAQGQPPVQPFIAIVKIVDRALRNGVTVNDLAAALDSTATVTGASLEFALSKLRGRVGRPPPNISPDVAAQIIADYERANGPGPRGTQGRALPSGP